MATVLEQYREKQKQVLQKAEERNLPLQELLAMQELNYRVCVLETFQAFCRSAPITTEVRALGYHFQMVEAYVGFVLAERRFGPKTDPEGQKRRETALSSLERVAQDGRRRFTSFAAQSQEQYKAAVSQYIKTILPVWLQYRETYITISGGFS